MNLIIIICSIIVVITVISLIINYFCQIKRYSSNQFKNNKEEVIKQLLKQSDQYYEDQKNKIQNQLDIIKIECDQKESRYLEKITYLDNEYEEAAARHKNKIESLEAELCQAINEHSKKEADALNSVQQYYINEKLRITNEFEDFSDRILQQKADLHIELEKEKQQQKEIIARFKHDEEVRQQADFYRIVLTENEISDVKKIRSIAEELYNPIILYKLIWENFYKNKFSELVGRVAGEKKCGIYKITNIINQKSYIGQTKQLFKERWRTHIKRGLKAEPTTNNKLYSSMWIDGVENFTFEILCECPAEKLNEYEKTYIQFYETMEWGYNSTGGNK